MSFEENNEFVSVKAKEINKKIIDVKNKLKRINKGYKDKDSTLRLVDYILKKDPYCIDALFYGLIVPEKKEAYYNKQNFKNYYKPNTYAYNILSKIILDDEMELNYYYLTREEILSRLQENFFFELQSFFRAFVVKYVNYEECDFEEETKYLFSHLKNKIVMFDDLLPSQSEKEEFVFYIYDFLSDSQKVKQYIKDNEIESTYERKKDKKWHKKTEQKMSDFFNYQLEKFATEIGVKADTSKEKVCFNFNNSWYEMTHEDFDLLSFILFVATLSYIWDKSGFFTGLIGAFIVQGLLKFCFSSLYDSMVSSLKKKENKKQEQDEIIENDESATVYIDTYIDQAKKALKQEKENKPLVELLDSIVKTANNLLKCLASTNESLTLFFETRYYPFITPYLTYIIEKNGKLTDEERLRFQNTFEKIKLLLEKKISKLQNIKTEYDYVEFDTLESEIDRCLKEEF